MTRDFQWKRTRCYEILIRYWDTVRLKKQQNNFLCLKHTHSLLLNSHTTFCRPHAICFWSHCAFCTFSRKDYIPFPFFSHRLRPREWPLREGLVRQGTNLSPCSSNIPCKETYLQGSPVRVDHGVTLHNIKVDCKTAGESSTAHEREHLIMQRGKIWSWRRWNVKTAMQLKECSMICHAQFTSFGRMSGGQ